MIPLNILETHSMKILSALCVAAGFAALSANVAQAASPEDVAARCVGAVNATVERCTNATASETQECVMKIRRLLAAGRERAAHRVARACVESLTNQAGNCSAHIKRICDHCVEFLLNVGEPELARRVDGACDDAVEKLRSNLQRAKGVIRSALGS